MRVCVSEKERECVCLYLSLYVYDCISEPKQVSYMPVHAFKIFLFKIK